jgi:hypothetical protein
MSYVALDRGVSKENTSYEGRFIESVETRFNTSFYLIVALPARRSRGNWPI